MKAVILFHIHGPRHIISGGGWANKWKFFLKNVTHRLSIKENFCVLEALKTAHRRLKIDTRIKIVVLVCLNFLKKKSVKTFLSKYSKFVSAFHSICLLQPIILAFVFWSSSSSKHSSHNRKTDPQLSMTLFIHSAQTVHLLNVSESSRYCHWCFLANVLVLMKTSWGCKFLQQRSWHYAK